MKPSTPKSFLKSPSPVLSSPSPITPVSFKSVNINHQKLTRPLRNFLKPKHSESIYFLFAVSCFMFYVNSVYAQPICNPAIPAQIGCVPSADPAESGPASAAIVAIFIARFLAAALSIGAIAFLLYLVWGAYKWLTSGGDQKQLAMARSHISQAIVGLLILASIFAITNIITPLLGLDFLTPSWPTF
jgi:hypothetical protein